MAEHGTPKSYGLGCRCDLCKAANAKRNAAFRRDKANEAKDPNDPRHGTYTFYRNHKCRCAPCKAAQGVKVVAEYQERMARPIDPNDSRHGTMTLYNAHGCRCVPCVDAGKDYRRNRGKAS